MAIKPDYQAGTVSITAGATALVGAGGANWVAADIQPGDTFKVQNLDAIVASVNSATSITLAEPWTGSTLAAAPYRIRYQPDGSRFTAALMDLVTSLANGAVAALQSLTSTAAANKLPFFNSSTTMGLTDLTVEGRTLIGAATAAAKRSTLVATGNLFKITYRVSSGTHTYDPETKLAEIELLGGGASGCAVGSAAANQSAAGGGGGAGGYVYKLIASPVAATIVIGAGGAVATSSSGLPTAGNNGGNSTFSDGTNSLTAGGGGGAPTSFGSQNTTLGSGGVGGTAAGGDVNVPGASGGGAFAMGTTISPAAGIGQAGDGGMTMYGSGGAGARIVSTTQAQGNGVSGTGYGSGGSGSVRMLQGPGNSFTDPGRPGLCVIREYR